MNAQHIGLILIIAGLLIAAGGSYACLPGDLGYHGKRFTFIFPIMTCIVVSIIVSILFGFFGAKK
jgi:hypothetical protein